MEAHARAATATGVDFLFGGKAVSMPSAAMSDDSGAALALVVSARNVLLMITAPPLIPRAGLRGDVP